jgi:GNAT superfamily N-acetyltransferase
MAELSGQLGYPSTEQDLVDRLAWVLQRDDHLVLVAQKDGRVVGWLHAFVALRIESPAFAEIGGLVVAQSERGRGLGQQLVEAAAAWARRKGLQHIRVRSNVVRTETHAFYLHLGFAQSKAQMVFTMATGVEGGLPHRPQ